MLTYADVSSAAADVCSILAGFAGGEGERERGVGEAREEGGSWTGERELFQAVI